MGGQSEQWLLAPNARGEELRGRLGDEICTSAPGTAGNRRAPVKGFLANIQRAAGGLPLRRIPEWLRPIVGWLMPRIGPRGIEFRGARVAMKALETVVHLRRVRPRRLSYMAPKHLWSLVRPCGLEPTDDEKS